MNTIIEKIRAEVEYSRDLNYKYYVKQGIGSPAEYRYDEDVRILSFLSALEQEEKPMNPQPVKIDIRKELASIEFMGVNDARDTETIARHFYELGRQSKQKVSEELEEEIDKRWKEWISKDEDHAEGILTKNEFAYFAVHFAIWQRHKMFMDGLKAVKSNQSSLIEKTIAGVFVKYGMDVQKQKMLQSAVKGKVHPLDTD